MKPPNVSTSADCRRAHRDRRTREATTRHSKAHAESRFPAPRPEQPRRHREQQRPRRPVKLEPEPRPQGRAKAAHVRVRPSRVGCIDKQVVLDAEPRRECDQPEGRERHDVAQVLLIHHHVDREGEQREEEVVGELQREEGRQIQPHIELGITELHLNEYSCRHQERHPCDEYQAQAERTCPEREPTPALAPCPQSRSRRSPAPAKSTRRHET